MDSKAECGQLNLAHGTKKTYKKEETKTIKAVAATVVLVGVNYDVWSLET